MSCPCQIQGAHSERRKASEINDVRVLSRSTMMETSGSTPESTELQGGTDLACKRFCKDSNIKRVDLWRAHASHEGPDSMRYQREEAEQGSSGDEASQQTQVQCQQTQALLCLAARQMEEMTILQSLMQRPPAGQNNVLEPPPIQPLQITQSGEVPGR
ncbi:unnamed protein product [Lota lota]